MGLCCCAAKNDNYKLQVRDWIIEGQDSLTDSGESMIDKASIEFGRLGKPSTNLPSTHSSFLCFGTAPLCEVHPDPVLLRTVLSFALAGKEYNLHSSRARAGRSAQIELVILPPSNIRD